MEAVDHLHVGAKDRFDGRRVRLGHIQHDHFNLVEFGLWTTLEPGNDLIRASALERGNRPAFVQVDDRRVVMVPLAPGVCINTDRSAQLAGPSATTPLKGPTKHGAFGETRATGQFTARTPPKEFRSHLLGEALGPLHPLAKALTLLPGPMVATSALKTPQMQPQPDGTLQHGSVTDAPRSAFFYPRADGLAPGTHDAGGSAFKM